MKKNLFVLALAALFVPTVGASPAAAQDSPCVECHAAETPGQVADWRLSRHGQMGLDCSVCHGTHTSALDVVELRSVTPETCRTCHADRVEQFSKGKHAIAWAALKAMPTTHALPMELADGMKGCGGCHKIGLKT
ncbi:MAG: cytochrome c3 family protein, partial [Gemmatimonadetes bacterium]|nr:cytochrome c3 family protein [Gemmatimonadota bacterium]